MQLKYQRDFEREADLLGVDYAAKAGYNAGAILRMLRKIYDEQRLNPTAIPPYFMSHPLTGERLAYLESVLGKAEWDLGEPAPSWRLERVQAIVRAYSQTRRQAVPPYERRLAAAKGGQRAKALELIGTLMVHGEEYEPGLHYLEEADRLGRSVDRELGRAYLRTGAFEKARERLMRVVKAAPEDWNAIADLGETYFQMGTYDKAVRMLEKAVELDAYNPELHRMLGRAMDKAGSRGAGFYHFARASELEGRAGQALAYYRKAAEALDESDPLMKDVRAHIGELAKSEQKRPRPPRAVPVPEPRR
ncbi:MAG: tetratricopeptide repeat protein [Deltaproteobacteria bacterium]|nr:MAG: tetratricopeptide repeat protein [Deltaproteobacteria bacterium]